jgi:nitroimidazol reductase NimA-like FMN-containing flavoprotein (pyridoxamine 5'-phosphate oxidase superfamily)
MRRNERQIGDRTEADRILETCMVCRLAMNGRPYPYVVPLHYVYLTDRLYLHCATEGRKLDLIAADNHVCFEVEGDVEIIRAERVCGWGTRYESVIGTGLASIVEDDGEKLTALRELMRKYSGTSEWDFSPVSIERLAVIRVDIDDLTGKRSRPAI